MEQRIISEELLAQFERSLWENERSQATIAKYQHDVLYFVKFACGSAIDKSLTIEYKKELEKRYALSSANSMIAALNTFLKCIGWEECCIKQFKVQRQIYCAEDRELTKFDYIRLVNTSRKKGNHRLCLLIQTICGTGIRVSELKFITAEAVKRGEAFVTCKNKSRIVFLVRNLQKKLLKYMYENNITSGPIFITKSGKPMNRCNIWKEMKALCDEAGVLPGKVFPHNLRHLFARTFYMLEKDIAKLADILGHTSIDTTRIYTLSTGVEHRRKMEFMRLII